LTLNDTRKVVVESGVTLLTGVIKGLAHYWPTDFRSLPPSQWNSSSTDMLFLAAELTLRAAPKVSMWCQRSEQQEISWHVPSAEELSLAGQLLTSIARPAMTRLQGLLDISSFGSNAKFNTWRDLYQLHAVVQCGSILLRPEQRDLHDE
jgi:hypothetical protein